MREPRLSRARWEWGVILLAVAVRLLAVGLLQSHRVPRSTYENGEIAANLLAGRGFSIDFPRDVTLYLSHHKQRTERLVAVVFPNLGAKGAVEVTLKIEARA